MDREQPLNARRAGHQGGPGYQHAHARHLTAAQRPRDPRVAENRDEFSHHSIDRIAFDPRQPGPDSEGNGTILQPIMRSSASARAQGRSAADCARPPLFTISSTAASTHRPRLPQARERCRKIEQTLLTAVNTSATRDGSIPLTQTASDIVKSSGAEKGSNHEEIYVAENYGRRCCSRLIVMSTLLVAATLIASYLFFTVIFT
jgi:hypothetical protein